MAGSAAAWPDADKRVGAAGLAMGKLYLARRWPPAQRRGVPACEKLEQITQVLNACPGKPVMLDIYADWCVACKVFDKYTFSDPHRSRANGSPNPASGRCYR
ncbi:thioredoxin family protein [Sodalis-like endosymbiont of Proechinophthirus fluctus]|uniref:thioredoxin family protein n=1 Tax=Sodalis-like endosymbiont of Proechinophthirus fluctus TaxID=1462730 RepID=UPI00195BEBF4